MSPRSQSPSPSRSVIGLALLSCLATALSPPPGRASSWQVDQANSLVAVVTQRAGIGAP